MNLAALVVRISSSKLGRVERGLSHPRRLSTLSLPERDPHASGKSLYGCPHSQHASDATIRLNQTLSWVRKLLLVFPSLRNPLRAVTATEGKMPIKYLPGSGNEAHKAVISNVECLREDDDETQEVSKNSRCSFSTFSVAREALNQHPSTT